MKSKMVLAITMFSTVMSLAACGGSASSSAISEVSSSEESSDYYVQEPDEYTTEEEYIDNSDTDGTAEIDDLSEDNGDGIKDVVDIDWKNFSYSFVDSDGYQIEETIKISPYITFANNVGLEAAWSELGGNITEIPEVDYCRELLYNWKYSEINAPMYVVGEISVNNKTKGYDFTESNKHGVPLFIEFRADDTYDAFSEDGGVYFESLENNNSNLGWEITKVFFTDPAQYCGDGGHGVLNYYSSIVNPIFYLGNASMNSNSWGPVRFVMIFPNKYTPAIPNGFTVYEHIEYIFGDNIFKLDTFDIE